jgi:hypothetical protein
VRRVGKLALALRAVILVSFILLCPAVIYYYVKPDFERFVVFGLTLLWIMLLYAVLQVIDIHDKVVAGSE